MFSSCLRQEIASQKRLLSQSLPYSRRIRNTARANVEHPLMFRATDQEKKNERIELSNIAQAHVTAAKHEKGTDSLIRSADRDASLVGGGNLPTRVRHGSHYGDHMSDLSLVTRERPAVTEVVAWAATNGDR